MKSAACGLLCAMVFNTARAQDAVLPEDFFISSLGRLSDTTEIKTLSNDSFQFKQHFQKRTTGGELLNFMTFCMASAIAVQRKSNGWSLGMQSDDDPNATSRMMTLVLLNGAEDAKKLPPTNQWLPYQTPGQFRPNCSHFVNPKYLWPESTSPTLENGAKPLSYEVGKDEPAYPAVNPRPTHRVTLSGTLPASQPIDDVEALYATDALADDPSAENCRRPSQDPGKLPPAPLQHHVVVPLNRSAESYGASIFVDQYLPGHCRWHLQGIRYRLHVPGFAEPMPIQHAISVVDPALFPKVAEYARAQPDHGARMELWCLNPPRYMTISCTDFDDLAHSLSPQQRDSVPAREREDANAAYLLPDTTSVEVNFRDMSTVGAPGSAPMQP